MSQRGYLVAISLVTALFVVVAAVGAAISYNWVLTNSWLLLGFALLYIVVSVGGAVLAHSNDDPMTSLVGGFICSGATR